MSFNKPSGPTNEGNDDVPFVPHAEFRAGLPRGRYRVVVNPTKARPYVMQTTRIRWFAIVLITVGAGLALQGQGWGGLIVAGLGVGLSRLVRHHAPRIALHMAQSSAAVYAEVTTNGVLEVRQADG
jgi:hypothetical protein